MDAAIGPGGYKAAVRAYLGLGSNVGSREAFLRAAATLLPVGQDLDLVALSEPVETDALGPPQAPYLNAAAAVETALPPLALLDRMLAIERALGRERRERWGPRTLDLDLLELADGPVDHPRLRVPHPGLTSRGFALSPLLEVAPALRGRYRAALDALGGPLGSRGWSAVERVGGTVRVRAATGADALALGVTAVSGGGEAAGTTRLVEARSPEELARRAVAEAPLAGMTVLGLDPPRGLLLPAAPASAARNRPIPLGAVRIRGTLFEADLL
ncbi:MAG: 2-amino-4-hydroxy-6-hydroxymethyldihydropteridine diphosphokinase [Sandaracinaceae bacterium]